MNIVRSQPRPTCLRRSRPRPPVLLIHGFPLDHTMWNAQIEALAEHRPRHRARPSRLRPIAAGQVDPSRGISMEQYADELVELLDALRITEPIVLAGFSMGGYIAWQFVRKHPRSLRALANAIREHSPIPTKAAPAASKWPKTSPSGAAARVAEMMGPKLFSARAFETQAELMAEVRRVVASTPPAAIAAAQRGMAARPDVTACCRRFTCRRWCSSANKMRSARAAKCEESPTRSPTPNSSKSRTGHMTTMENPVAVNEALLQFINSLR